VKQRVSATTQNQAFKEIETIFMHLALPYDRVVKNRLDLYANFSI